MLFSNLLVVSVRHLWFHYILSSTTQIIRYVLREQTWDFGLTAPTTRTARSPHFKLTPASSMDIIWHWESARTNRCAKCGRAFFTAWQFLIRSGPCSEFNNAEQSTCAQLGNASPECSLRAASQFRWLPALHWGDESPRSHVNQSAVLVMKQTMEDSSFAVLLFQK